MLDKIQNWMFTGWSEQSTVEGSCSTTSDWIKKTPVDKWAEREWRRFFVKYEPHVRHRMRRWAYRQPENVQQFALDRVEDLWHEIIAQIIEKKSLIAYKPKVGFRRILFRLVKCRMENLLRDQKPKTGLQKLWAPVFEGFTRERRENEKLLSDCISYLKKNFVERYDPAANDLYGVTRRDHWTYVQHMVEDVTQRELAKQRGVTESAISQVIEKVNRYLRAEATIYLRDLRQAAHLAPKAA